MQPEKVDVVSSEGEGVRRLSACYCTYVQWNDLLLYDTAEWYPELVSLGATHMGPRHRTDTPNHVGAS